MNMSINPNYQKYESFSDLELVEKILNNNKESFEGIVLRYETRLKSYLFRLLNFNNEDADDCLSQTFVRAYTKLTSYQKERSFSSWLYRIAHNIAVDHIRKNNGKHFTFDTEHFGQFPAKTKDEFTDKLDFILNKLDSQNKDLLILFYVQGLSLNELSDIYNIIPNTIAVRLKRAKEKAKEKAKKLISQYYA
jgi:RNA polymerase sigma-70 factor, ECF subfamily